MSDPQELLNARNTSVITQVVKDLQQEVRDLKILVTTLQTTLGGLQERLNHLETANNLLRAKLYGNGPTG